VTPKDTAGPPQSAQQLLVDVRAGHLDAAYELLGKQAPIKAWREALEHISRQPDDADVELAAHRALRRPKPVVAALLDLVEAVRTSKAAHVAHAISRLRSETDLVGRATAIRDEIRASNDLDTALAREDGWSALYVLLNAPLPDQRDAMTALSSDKASRDLIVVALDTEYQRLLELGREVRWTSGSYRYFLRHALADLALVADTEGRTWDRAFRLLQQQVENPEENQELIDALPASTRRRFLSWGLERENATQHAVRTRFVLRSARDHPKDVERRDVVAVLKVDDPDTRAEALLTAVSLAPDVADVERDIAEWLGKADASSALQLVQALLDVAPSRLRPDLLTAESRQLIADVAQERAPEVARAAAALVDEARDADAVTSAIDMLDRLDVRVGVSPDVYAEVALALMRRIEDDSRWQAAFDRALSSPGVVRGAWSALPKVREPERAHHLRRVLERDSPDEAGHATARLLQDVPETTPALRDVLLDAVFKGALEPDELRTAPESSLRELAVEARVRIEAIERDIELARQALGSGQEDVEQRMRVKLRPIVERAIERAEGNDRLAHDYRRLLPSARHPADAAKDEVAVSIPEPARAELQRVGADLREVDGSWDVEFVERSDDGARIRYLIALDKRTQNQSGEGWPVVLSAYVTALARHGDAASLITELFERGPRMKLVLGLSSDTRRQLLEAAIENGFEVPDAWPGHETLGEWLTDLLRAGPDAAGEQSTSTPLDTLLTARARAGELAELGERTTSLEHEAKLAFVSECRAVFDDLELAIDGYVQLWRALAGLGIAQVEPLGAIVERGTLDPTRHEIVGDANGNTYVVRAAGIAVDGEVVAPARIERLET
jgi:hypothetical protein